MIKLNQQINSDNINSAFISKKTTGTQIMLGGLNIQGSLLAKDITMRGVLDAGSNQIKTTGRIDAGTFYGNGAGITNINAGNVSGGTLSDSRLSSNVMLLNSTQVITGVKTFATEQHFVASGSTYQATDGGYARAIKFTGGISGDFINLTTNLKASGNVNTTNLYLGEGSSGTVEGNIYRLDGLYGTNDIRFGIGSTLYHTMGTTGLALGKISSPNAMLDVVGDAIVSKNLEVQGELKSGGRNEFPDPLLLSKNVSQWTGSPANSISFDSVQTPSDIEAAGSLKVVNTDGANNWVFCSYTFNINPGDFVTFSLYMFSTTTGNNANIGFEWLDANSAKITNYYTADQIVAPTSWKRFQITRQAPSDATKFRLRVDNDGAAGAVMYFTGFQVERGRAMSGFKLYDGGKNTAGFFDKGIKLSSGAEIHSAYNNDYILKDHGNGGVTINAAGNNLHIGYVNTARVILSSNLYTSDSSTIIADTGGKLFYRGTDIDSKYVNADGDSLTGNLTFTNTLQGIKWSMNTDGASITFKNDSDADSDSFLLFETRDNGNEYFKFQVVGGSTTTELLSIKTDNLRFKGDNVWHAGNLKFGTTSGTMAVGDHGHSDYVRGVRASYNKVTGDEDGTDGWYTLFTVSDSSNAPVQCNIRAYAHTSVSFIVSKGYSESSSFITVLHANVGSTNGGYKFLKGIRIIDGGKVQIKLNGGSNVQIDAQLIGSGVSNPSLASSLVKETASVAVYDVVDPLDDGSIRTKNELYSGSNKVWHAGDFNPENKLNISGGTMAAALMFLNTATGGPSASTPTALSYGKLQSYGAFTIAADTDGSKTENIIIATGYGVSPTSAQGLMIGYDTLTWKNNIIWHAGNDGSGSGLDADKLDGLESASFLRSNTNDTFTGTLTLNGKLDISGDIEADKPIYLTTVPGSHREGGKLNSFSRLSGRIANRNSDFINQTMTGYATLDTANSGRVIRSLITDTVTPNASGYMMRVSYDPARNSTTAASPGFGGFAVNLSRDGSGDLSGWNYRAGNRYMVRVIAYIPSGRTLNYNAGTYGTGGGVKWLTSQSGTGNWQEYTLIHTIGTTGTFGTIGSFHITGGSDTAFTWDIAVCQFIGLDEVPDVDRAPSLNVGYKPGIDMGWGEIYSTGKITTGSSLNATSFSVSGTSSLAGNLQLTGTAGWYMIDLGSNGGTSSEHYGIGLSNAASNRQMSFHISNYAAYGSTGIRPSFSWRSSGGVELMKLEADTGNLWNKGNITVVGNLIINKSSNWSYIYFPSSANDPGFIGHYENNNASEMRFSVSDDVDGADFFSFGGNTGTSTVINGGSWNEGARITSSGAATFKGMTVNGNTLITGGLDVNGQVLLEAGESDGIAIGSAKVQAVGPNELLMRASEIRIGAETSGWDYKQWAGIKYNHTLNKLTIGGPASTDFKQNGTASRADLSLEGFASAFLDAPITIKPAVDQTIGGTTMANGWILLGTSTSGMALDPNELYVTGTAFNIGTIGGYDMLFRPNNTDRMIIKTSGYVGIGTTTPSEKLDVNGNIWANGYLSIAGNLKMKTGSSIYIGNQADSGDRFRMHQSVSDAYLDYGTGSLFIRAGTTTKFTMDSAGRVGINASPNSSQLNVGGGAMFSDWVRVTGTKGVYFEDYGGGWYMTDSTWIRTWGNKSIYQNSGVMRTDGELQVGSSSQLSISPSQFIWQGGTIFSNKTGKVSINQASNTEHPLHVKSNGSYMGINIQNTATTDISGLSFQNNDGKYSWHLATSATANSDLSFYSGLNTSLSALPEVTTFYAAGGIWTSGDVTTNKNLFIRGGSGRNTEVAKVTLAIGDNDTGFNWMSDGQFSLWANNGERIRFNSNETIFYQQNVFNANSNFSVNTTAGRGYRFWNSDTYKIYMSSVNDSTWGGRMDDSSDYNMYFRMGGGSNRGFVFENGTGTNGAVAQITGSGKVYAKDGYRTGNFEIVHNSSEDSLDFLYVG